MQKIILASESVRRRELLTQIGMNFQTKAKRTQEDFDMSLGLEEALMQVAQTKAQVIAEDYPNDIVIGADTIVVIDDQILGKPKNPEHAKQMLQQLSNRTHQVYTGVAIIHPKGNELFYEKSEVTFYELDESLIDEYIKSKACNDKAGSYGIQDKGCLFVESIKGDYNNIVGLPIAQLYRKLKEITR